MTRDPLPIDRETATRIVRRTIDPRLSVTDARPLHGGSINRVFEWTTDGSPSRLVAKLNSPRHAGTFRREQEMLGIYQAAGLPVPEVYARVEASDDFPGCGLLMQRVPGGNLSDARITQRGRVALDRQLADQLAQLHTHHRESYGSAHLATGHERWIDAFYPTIAQEYNAVRQALTSRTRGIVEDLLDALPAWLEGAGPPSLVHGDLWATNLLVDDAKPDRPKLLAFIDGQASYSDPDYELAYLRLFHTAGDAFFQRYHLAHPRRDGFERRCRVYWLSTMMMHVRIFGDRYLPPCEEMAQRVRSLASG
jgi:fructosamine-3-kinase